MKLYTTKWGWIEDNRTPEEEPRKNAGEYLLKDWCRTKGHKVIDVSDNRQFFEPDVDLLIQPVKGDTVEPVVAVEVKYDRVMNRTGNLFVEYHHTDATHGSQVGWFHKCQANLLFYMDAVNKVYYVFKYNEFKDYINKNNWKYRKTWVDDKSKYGVYGTSFGWLVPLNELKENIKVQTLKL